MANYKQLIDDTIVVIPAYNANQTIINVIRDIQISGFQNIVISDDCSPEGIIDLTDYLSESIVLIKQSKNLGYGGNQKFLYDYALKNNFKFIIMIHGDLQYSPSLIPSMITMLKFAKYDFVIGSRILGGNCIKKGMPIPKYVANRLLTLFQNTLTGYKLSEYHTGLRAYRSSTLRKIQYHKFSNNFLFDNQVIIGIINEKLAIGEVSCTTKYDINSSSINYKQSIIYAIGVIKITLQNSYRQLFQN
ncbi:glycosyltransferase family 2 protein [Flavobacterium sp. 14A]|uniref:glycosyltransferase family 2 protein n=1 Tax=Flavobacterium sp. 14A TaxID=2735896 RepID=UPI001570F85F|nr:glycosyltransferase family 2 protein [Flavobacterium sp. 14A]NRT13137.1 GT2 family glycosyltransferase [Flavobacterium sp. 14A]